MLANLETRARGWNRADGGGVGIGWSGDDLVDIVAKRKEREPERDRESPLWSLNEITLYLLRMHPVWAADRVCADPGCLSDTPPVSILDDILDENVEEEFSIPRARS